MAKYDRDHDCDNDYYSDYIPEDEDAVDRGWIWLVCAIMFVVVALALLGLGSWLTH